MNQQPTTNNQQPKRIVIAITGASGSVYARSLLRNATHNYDQVYAIISDNAAGIMREELGMDDLRSMVETPEKLTVLDNANLGAPPASGSHRFDGMVVVPCSMGTVGRIAAGISLDLVSRVADVCLKEQRKLILVPRESPFSVIHLENLLKLARAGALIMPAAPPFYNKPQSIDDLVNGITARILAHLGIEQDLVPEWK
jgi:flavin prenyltransferase